MKKLVALIIFALLITGLAVAQGSHTGSTTYSPTSDVLGGHNNGGRGCAGCHAPHSGGRGAGGVITAGTAWNTVVSVDANLVPTIGSRTPTKTAAGVALGDVGLWGTDPGPLTSGMPILYQNTGAWEGYTNLAGTSFADGEVFSGIVTCLTCHDGNVSKGAMMANQSYEQFFNTLPTGNMSGQPLYQTNSSASGFQAIPTLLGNDGGTLGDYNNDHPIGPMATIGAAGACGAGMTGTPPVYTQALCQGETFGTGLTLTPGDPTVHASPNYVVTAVSTTQYGAFLANYGAPALKNLAKPEASGATPDQAWITCTTCHNQHVMNVYKAGDGSKSYQGVLIQGGKYGKYATYFFVNGPYNPGAPFNSMNAPSTMQFCRQCHFSFSNESYGLNTVGTAF